MTPWILARYSVGLVGLSFSPLAFKRYERFNPFPPLALHTPAIGKVFSRVGWPVLLSTCFRKVRKV